MPPLEQRLILSGLIGFFILIVTIKKYMQHPLTFFDLLRLLGLALASYAAFAQYQLHQYYQRAFQAPHHIHECGTFTQCAEIKPQTRQGIITEKAFYCLQANKG